MQHRIHAIKITQNERDILLFTIPAKKLKDLSYMNPREIDRESGIQRTFQPQRSREIAKYIDSEDAVLANNIIINLELERLGLTLEEVYDDKNCFLDIGKMIDRAQNINEMNRKGKIAFVIDGQHRLRAFEYSKNDIPLVIAALVNLTLAEVAEIFVKINYYQKPVNKSLVLDLLGISKDVFPKYFKLHEVVKDLNEDIESPFYNNIKMLGIGKGLISQASIISSIEKYKIESVLEEIGIEPNKTNLYNVIWNFFKAVQNEFVDFWEEKSILTKSVGIRALFLLLIDVVKKFAAEDKEFSYEEIGNYLKTFDKEFLRSPDITALGGEKGVKTLYHKLKDEMEKCFAK